MHAITAVLFGATDVRTKAEWSDNPAKLLHLSGIESCGAGLGEHGTMLLRRVCMLGNFDVHLLQ